jgi:Ran GTPase-activating protein (RanGAP) involved in mRNA processing and transport
MPAAEEDWEKEAAKDLGNDDDEDEKNIDNEEDDEDEEEEEEEEEEPVIVKILGYCYIGNAYAAWDEALLKQV